jgi:sulfatase maturation enzyme AslB (radical SAM superfamily)
MPRDKLYLRYCPIHKNMLALDNYENIGYGELCKIFNEDPTVLDIREKFLNGDFHGAGCSEACNFMAAFRVGETSYSIDDDENAGGWRPLKKAYLSLGPDCNIRCRYCLDTDNFEVDFGSCKPKFADFIVPFVHNGGHLLLTGGETFLPKWGLVDKLKELARLGDNKGSIEIYTNATLLDEEVCGAVLTAPVSFVGISMDTSRPELFNHIRRGSDFAHVLGNAKQLLDKRNEKGLALPQIKILCAVMKSTAEHLEETIDFYLNEGFDISLYILFAANFSPDFCERESIDTLNLNQLRNVSEQLERSEKKWGDRLFSAAFKGQLINVIKQKSVNATAQQILGGGHYAKRKEGINQLIKNEVGSVKIFELNRYAVVYR